ncbi:rhodanese-like domain-containing protein [Enterococcus sp. AZ072]|uniref:rhodanese-like domain-containing protein n=1 Tax=unclassified Enterococcus TaxID=2608891 RepID=UPI003D2CBC0F
MNYSMTTQEFVALALTKPLHVLDLRDPDFFDTEEVRTPSSVTQIPLTQLPNRYNELDKSETYYLFSQSGKRAKTMARFLTEKGYHAVDVIGGTTAVLSYLEIFHPAQLSLVKHSVIDCFSQSLIVIKMLRTKEDLAQRSVEFA